MAARRPLTKIVCAAGVAALAAAAALGQATVAHALVITEVSTPLSPFGIAVLGSDTYFTQAVSGCTTACGNDAIYKLTGGVGTPTQLVPLPPNSNPKGIVADPADNALWFAEQGLAAGANRIGRVTPDGHLTTTVLPTGAGAVGITVGPDGNIWFAETSLSRIGRLTPCSTDNCLTLADVAAPGPNGVQPSAPLEIASGPQSSIWFTQRDTGSIGEISAAAGSLGTPQSFAIPTSGSKPYGITLGADGNMWFTEHTGNKVGKVNVTCALTPPATDCITEFSLPTRSSAPAGITSGPGNNLWFGEQQGNKVGEISTAGAVLGEFAIPTTGSQPQNIVASSNRLWFTETASNKIGFFDVSTGTTGNVGYVLDGYGGLHPYTSGGSAMPNPHTTAYWNGWNIARSVAVAPGLDSGYVLDGYGGVHPFTSDTSNAWGGGSTIATYFGFDIARDLVVRPDGRSGYLLDGYGGIHPWYVNGVPAAPPPVIGSGYWSGWDIARRIVLNPADPTGESGYVLDAFGGLHMFYGPDTGANMPVGIDSSATGAYWTFKIARDVAMTANGAGYILDGYGGVHPVGSAVRTTFQSDTTYWKGWDIARALVLTSNQTGAYVLDGYGGMHPIATAPPVTTTGYWAGWDIAKTARGAG